MKETKPEKVDESNYFSFSDIGDQKLIYEFGKIYDESYKQIYSTGKPLFNKPDMQKNLNIMTHMFGKRSSNQSHWNI